MAAHIFLAKRTAIVLQKRAQRIPASSELMRFLLWPTPKSDQSRQKSLTPFTYLNIAEVDQRAAPVATSLP